ncbi:MAG: ABC transporter permease [Anaerolineales bacterium]|nr:ABC transporter permease [Anaerolineales bacterium]
MAIGIRKSEGSKQAGKAPIYIYDADQRWGTWQQRLEELIHYRYLLRNLVVRDLKARYKNSLLGIMWSLLNPLGLMIVFTVVFSVMSRFNNNTRYYAVFVLVGLVPWTFFTGALHSGAVSVVGNVGLVKKVYFPRELLPVTALLSNLVNFSISFLLIILFLFIFGIGLSRHILWVPAILITQLTFMLGLIMFVSALTVFFRDILMILDVLLTAWFFATPIFYPLEDLERPLTILGTTLNSAQVMRWINPMASIIDGYRTVLWGTRFSNGPVSMDPSYLLRTFITSAIILVLGYLFFLRAEPLFGEKL